MIGKTISHYKILEKLGEGGMGMVYKAEDLKLKRTVALKFLPPELTRDPEAKARFIQEAQAASALDHPNICTIHEIDETADGQLFIVMACYDGETLKKKIANSQSREAGSRPAGLSMDSVIDIAIQIARGLVKAHEYGIIHRDIKPGNIMITKDGMVKILDFGLAKLAGQVGLTKTGTTIGTVSYMSPEQSRGKDVDHRTDIWSYGVVLYEMITGKSPFKGEYDQSIMYLIINEDPEFITKVRKDVPLQLEKIIKKAMAKNPEDRYQDMKKILSDLKILKDKFPVTTQKEVESQSKRISNLVRTRYGIIGSVFIFITVVIAVFYFTSQHDDSVYYPFTKKEWKKIEESRNRKFVIAVLPFWGMSEDALNEGRIMQAMIERELLQELGADPRVKIIKRNSKNLPRTHTEAKTLGKKLDANLVIWGDIFSLRDEVEIQPYITTVYHLVKPWSVSMPIYSEALQINRTEQGQLSFRRTKAEELSNLTFLIAGRYYHTYYNYDKALEIFQKIEPQTSLSQAMQGEVYYEIGEEEKAEELFLQAITQDTNDVFNYLRLTWNYILRHKYDKAKELVLKAIDLTPELSECYKALGWIFCSNHQFDEAIEQTQKAIQLNPTSEDLYFCLGWIYRMYGKYSLALIAYEEAIDLNPYYEWPLIGLGMTYRSMNQFKQAENSIKKAIEVNPHIESSYPFLASVYRSQKKYDEAYQQIQKSMKLDPDNSLAYKDLAHLYMHQGIYDKAETAFLKALEFNPDDGMIYNELGRVYQSMGMYEKAVTFIEKAVELIPSSLFFHNHLGEVQMQMRQYDAAINEFKKASQLVKKAFGAYPNLGRIHLIQNQFDLAESAFKKALNHIDSLNIQHRTLVTRKFGYVYLAKGEFQEAVKLFKSNIESESNSIEDVVLYFIALKYIGHHEEASNEIKKLVDKENGNDSDWNMQVALYHLGKITEDSLLAETVNHIYPNIIKQKKSEAYAHIGFSYIQKGLPYSRPTSSDTIKAVEYFQKCLNECVYPDFDQVWAKSELARIETIQRRSNAK